MTSQHPLANSLLVNAPAEELTDELQLFGRFVGSWTVLCQNARGALEGEVYFGWVLGGRAVQDVWLVPGRAQSGPGQPPYQFHGSTLRFFDRTLGSWRSTWIEPVNGRVRRFVGRPKGNDIVLVSDDEEPRLRWSFTDITLDSFTWRGEISDSGGLWVVDETMWATRIR